MEGGGRSGVYVTEPGVLRDYDAFLVDPVLVYFGTSAAAVDPDELAQLTRTLHDEVVEELTSGGYSVVESPGPGILRIRAALTDVDPSRPAANIGAKAAGIASGVSGFMVPAVDLGGASIEVEMLDSETGVRVAALRDARKGRRFVGTIASAQKWGHAEAAFKEWAKELRDHLDGLRDTK